MFLPGRMIANNAYSYIFKKNQVFFDRYGNHWMETMKRKECRKKSYYMTGQVFCDDPVTVVAMQPVWQHLEPALDGFVGI